MKYCIGLCIIAVIAYGGYVYWEQRSAFENTIPDKSVDDPKGTSNDSTTTASVSDNTPDSPPVTSSPATSPSIPVVEITAELPESFNGVAMTTYKSPFGFEITFPKGWMSEERTIDQFAYRVDGEIAQFLVSPTMNVTTREGVDYGPALSMMIITENLSNKYRMSGYPPSGHVKINNLTWLYWTGEEGVTVYSLLANGKGYSIQINDRGLYDLGTSMDEMLWILSTFKVLK